MWFVKVQRSRFNAQHSGLGEPVDTAPHHAVTFHFRDGISVRIPYALGYLAGKLFDLASFITGKKYPISSIRIKKFCSTTQFETSVSKTGFIPPVSLLEGLTRTIRYEFLETHPEDSLFFTE